MVSSDGQVLYVYGEITGYYLHWLSSLPESTAEVRKAAELGVAWLAKYLQGEGGPRTRIYLRDEVEDWRNEALFFFDLAMIAGGVSRLAKRGLVAIPPSLVNDLQSWLQLFVSDG